MFLDDLSPEHLDMVAGALRDKIAYHAKQASRNGASDLARRGHLSLEADYDSILQRLKASRDAQADAQADEQEVTVPVGWGSTATPVNA